MEHQDGYFSGPRGLQVYHQAWLPEGDPKAVLLIVHGLAEHSGRYMNVVNYFVPRGFAVYGLDLIGHGKSDGVRDFIKQFDDFTAPIKKFFDIIQKLHPGKPIFLVGHSMGGLISTYYLLDHQDELAGAVLSASSVKVPDFVTPTTVFLGKVLSFLVPKAGLFGLDASAISQDPAVVEAYVNDPLVYTGKSTARLSAESLKAIMRVEREAGNITLPVLIVHGSEDKLANPAASKMLYELVSSPDKTLKIYNGYYHEVFNEPGRDVVFKDMDEWLEKHLE